MSSFKILIYPDKKLREVAAPITTFDDALRNHVNALLKMMYEDQGCGLAATQIGLPLRLFVMDTSPQQNQPQCFINPEIIQKHGEAISEEGCLSFPGSYAKVIRAKEILVRYFDEFGQEHTQEASGLASHCIQHESEHLEGILFIDHLSKLKRMMLLKKVEKYLRAAS